MAQPTVSRAEARRRVRAVEKFLRRGHPPKGVNGNGILGAIAKAAVELGLSPQALNNNLRAIKRQLRIEPKWALYKPAARAIPEPPAYVSDEMVLRHLKRGSMSAGEIAEKLRTDSDTVNDAVAVLRGRGIMVTERSGKLAVEKAPAPRISGAPPSLSLKSDKENRFRIGAITDTHGSSKYHRRDVLEAEYDRFAARGVTTVLHAGNYIEGEAPFNRYDIEVSGIDAQLQMLARDYPKRKGITTYFVVGDDHEGWYAQRDGIDVGKYTERVMREAGRDDFLYLHYMEADIALVNARTGQRCMLRLMHPGGGSSYAISYSPQKIAESFEGGDKPAVLVLGHYHKGEILNYRNVWIVQAFCTKDQDPFMRKKKIEAHIGGIVLDLEQDPETGAIIECNGMRRYFNRAYYTARGERFSHHGPVEQIPRSAGGV